jgi:hypothetical protein
VLSALNEAARREYVATHKHADLTPHTVTDQRVLLRQLDTAGDYTFDREEYALGTACVAAAVPSRSIVAAVAVSVPAHRVKRVVEHGEALRRATRQIAYAGVGEDGRGVCDRSYHYLNNSPLLTWAIRRKVMKGPKRLEAKHDHDRTRSTNCVR